MASSGGSGKDTVADIMSAYLASYDRSVKKYALADGIYDICYEMLGDESSIKRSHLQGVGESFRNIFGKDVWINDTDDRINSDQKYLDDVIVTDIRKLREFSHYFVDKGFVPVYVKVDKDIALARLKERDGYVEQENFGNKIEKELNFIESLPTIKTNIPNVSKVDVPNNSVLNGIYIVDNNSDVDELRVTISMLIESLAKEEGWNKLAW